MVKWCNGEIKIRDRLTKNEKIIQKKTDPNNLDMIFGLSTG